MGRHARRYAGRTRYDPAITPGARLLRNCEVATHRIGAVDKRSTIRARAEGQVQASVRGRNCLVRLHNLSAGGCLIEMTETDPVAGDEIVISLIDGLQVCGRVAWKSADLVGVEFADRIHPALVEHLKALPTFSRSDNWIPRDRFGRALASRGASTRSK